MNRPTIVLAEDHLNVAEQLRRLLSASFDVVAVVGHGEALVKAALINSAVDMDDEVETGPAPNMDEGWGRVDLTQIIGTPGEDTRIIVPRGIDDTQCGGTASTEYATGVM